MASNTFEEYSKLEELNTYKEMIDKSQQHPNKLIAVLLNVEYPGRGNLEHNLLWWRRKCEEEYDVLFFKCICSRNDKQLKAECSITITPAFIFFQNGQKRGHLNNLNKPVCLGEHTADEESIKDTIRTLCSSSSCEQQNLNE